MRSCNRSVTLAACLMLPAALAGQTVHGTVRDSSHTIVGATVRLIELDRIEQSGANGTFTFGDVPNGDYTITATSPGYAPLVQRVEVGAGGANIQLALKSSTVALQKIVVSATPSPRSSTDEYQSVDSKSQVDFLNGTGSNFAEKISDLPGVNVRGNGSAPSRPVLRGMTDNDVLVVENGLRMGDIATFDPAHATPIEALGVAQVDVVRGPASTLYGPNTLGGVVNVITDVVPSVADHPVSGVFNFEGNSVDGEYSGFLRNVWSSASSAFSVSAGTLKAGNIAIPAQNYFDPASGGAFYLNAMPQTDQHSNEAGVGFSHQGAFGFWGIGVKHFEINYGVTGDPPNADWETVPPTTSRISQQRNTVEFRTLLAAGDGWLRDVKFNASYNDYTHSEFPTAQDSTGVSDPQANHFHKQDFNGVLQFVQRPSGNLSGTLGVWANIEDLTIEGQQPLGPNSLTTGLAGYAFEELSLSPHTTLSVSARFDYNGIQTRPYAASLDSTFQTINVSRTSNAVTASAGIVTHFTDQLTGSFNVARSFRAPTVQELFANGLDAASGTYSIGDASLGPEAGIGIDASLKGDFGRMSFDLSPYANFINNYIYGYLTGDTLDAFPVRQFAATNARLLGFEASVNIEPAEALSLRLSSDYVNAEDLKNNVPLPFIPPLRGLVRATWHESMWRAIAEVRMAEAQNRLGAGDTPTPGYAMANLGFGVRFTHDGVVHDIGLHCDNVFNTVYRDALSVVKDFIPQPGRGFRLEYTLSY